MFAIAFMLISTPEKTGDIESKAEVLITIRWADEHPDDVDALVEDLVAGWCGTTTETADLCILIGMIAAYLQTRSTSTASK